MDDPDADLLVSEELAEVLDALVAWQAWAMGLRMAGSTWTPTEERLWQALNRWTEWRRRKQAPVADVTSVSPAAPLVQNTIHVDGATLRRLATEQIRAERGEADIDDATPARRARLVSESP